MSTEETIHPVVQQVLDGREEALRELMAMVVPLGHKLAAIATAEDLVTANLLANEALNTLALTMASVTAKYARSGARAQALYTQGGTTLT